MMPKSRAFFEIRSSYLAWIERKTAKNQYDRCRDSAKNYLHTKNWLLWKSVFVAQPFGYMKLFTGFVSEAETWHEPSHKLQWQQKIILSENEGTISWQKSVQRSKSPRSPETKTAASSPPDRYYSTANRSTSHVDTGGKRNHKAHLRNPRRGVEWCEALSS